MNTCHWQAAAGRKTYTKVLEQVLGLAVDLEKAALVVRGVEGRDLGDVLVLALTLLLLELEGDAADGATLNALHQVGGVAGNLVAEALGGDDGNLVADALVGLKVEGQARVVTLDDDLGGLLDGLGADATHVGGVVVVGGGGGEGVVVVGWRKTDFSKRGSRHQNFEYLEFASGTGFSGASPAVRACGRITCRVT